MRLDADPPRPAPASPRPLEELATLLSVSDATTELGRAYRVLVENPHATTAEAAAVLGIPEPDAARHLARLRDAGAAVATAAGPHTRWEPKDPNELEHLTAGSVELEAAAARRRLRTLDRGYREIRSAQSRRGGIEVIYGTQRRQQRWLAGIAQARHQVRGLDAPPYLAELGPGFGEEQLVVQRDAIARGVRLRSIYDRRSLGHRVRDNIPEVVEPGEEARVLSRVPLKLVVVDEDLAIVTLDPVGETDRSSLVVYPSGLLDALIETFEVLWEAATPLGGRQDSPVAEQILRLLAAGATDETVARHLRLSRRSVTRHLRTVYAELGVTTRFQAGAQAVRRGLIRDVSDPGGRMVGMDDGSGRAGLDAFMAAYARAANSHEIDRVVPFLAEDAVYWFSDGSYRGVAEIAAAIERTFRTIADEVYEIHDLEWPVVGPDFAVCRYRFAWTGVVGGRRRSGAGRGTNAVARRDGRWVMVHEHLSV